jgi:hypothetical protein
MRVLNAGRDELRESLLGLSESRTRGSVMERNNDE